MRERRRPKRKANSLPITLIAGIAELRPPLRLHPARRRVFTYEHPDALQTLRLSPVQGALPLTRRLAGRRVDERRRRPNSIDAEDLRGRRYFRRFLPNSIDAEDMRERRRRIGARRRRPNSIDADDIRERRR